MSTKLLEKLNAQSSMSAYSKIVPPIDPIKDLNKLSSGSEANISGLQSKM